MTVLVENNEIFVSYFLMFYNKMLGISTRFCDFGALLVELQ